MKTLLIVCALLVMIIPLSLSTWSAMKGKQNKGWWVLWPAIVIGSILLMPFGIGEVSVKNILTIKAAADQAQQDAQQIRDILRQLEAQSQIANRAEKHAMDAKRVADELIEKNAEANTKLKKLDETISVASTTLADLKLRSKFTLTLTAAQSDNRKAFDQLKAWADDPASRFQKEALAAWQAIMDEYADRLFIGGAKLPWKEGVDPNKLTLQELKGVFSSVSASWRPAVMEFIWNKPDIPRKDKMKFLVDVLSNKEESLTVTERAGRIFNAAAKLQYKGLATDRFLDWWSENASKIEP